MNPTPAIEWCQVTKDFSLGLRGVRLRALDRFSLRVESGEIVALIGPNGSGKSTAIKVALGLLAPTAGICTVLGQPSSSVEVRRHVGYLPEAPYFYRYLTGRELVTFYGRMCGLRGAHLLARVKEVLAWVGLNDAAKRTVGSYSKGMLQRVGFAQALVHDPRVVILDEPTAGVDIRGVEEMLRLVLELKAQGKTVVLTSHIFPEVEAVCDRVALIDHGRALREFSNRRDGTRPGLQALFVDPLPPGSLADLRSWLASHGSSLVAVESIRPGNPRAVHSPGAAG